MDLGLDLVLNLRSVIGEGLFWDADDDVLYWIDVIEGKLHVYEPVSKTNETFCLGQFIGAVAPKENGGVILAMQHGIFSYNTARRRLVLLAAPESHLPDNRFNDGKCDCRGRFWAGTMSNAENEGTGTSQPAGTLYLFDSKKGIRPMLKGVTISNGLAWNKENTVMYYIDSPTRQVSAFDFDEETGAITNRRIAVTIPEGEGVPDGMCADSEGMLWTAQWGGYCVSRWDPQSGKRLYKIDVPVKNVSNCTFGGKNLDELYITTSTIGSENETKERRLLAGGLFRIKPGVTGVKSFKYKG